MWCSGLTLRCALPLFLPHHHSSLLMNSSSSIVLSFFVHPHLPLRTATTSINPDLPSSSTTSLPLHRHPFHQVRSRPPRCPPPSTARHLASVLLILAFENTAEGPSFSLHLSLGGKRVDGRRCFNKKHSQLRHSHLTSTLSHSLLLPSPFRPFLTTVPCSPSPIVVDLFILSRLLQLLYTSTSSQRPLASPPNSSSRPTTKPPLFIR